MIDKAEWSEMERIEIKPEPKVAKILRSGANTYEQRNAIYGDNYKHFGPALLAVFGGAVPPIETDEAAIRLNLVICCLNKLTRYAQTFETGGHRDSAHDLMVYAAMLEEMT